MSEDGKKLVEFCDNMMGCNDKPTIVTNWDSMPPEVYANGEIFSTRVLADNYRKMKEALVRISKLHNAPDPHLMGDAETGIHCGVEDTGCNDRYEGANYGYSCGVENMEEWVRNEICDLATIAG